MDNYDEFKEIQWKVLNSFFEMLRKNREENNISKPEHEKIIEFFEKMIILTSGIGDKYAFGLGKDLNYRYDKLYKLYLQFYKANGYKHRDDIYKKMIKARKKIAYTTRKMAYKLKDDKDFKGQEELKKIAAQTAFKTIGKLIKKILPEENELQK